MIIGYVRGLKDDQTIVKQLKALGDFGCEKLFIDIQADLKERSEFDRMLTSIEEGDVLVVWRLDRIGKSLKHVLRSVAKFKEQRIDFVSICDNIDTTSINGEYILYLFELLVKCDSELTSENTRVGLELARSKGKIGGRKKGLSKEKLNLAIKAYQLSEMKDSNSQNLYSTHDILGITGLKKTTFFRYKAIAKEYLINRSKLALD